MHRRMKRKAMNIWIVGACVCGGATAFVSPRADAQQPYQPTDNDLHAAYCLSVSNAMLSELQSAAISTADSELNSTPKGVPELSERVSRLRAYVLPKMLTGDDATVALAAAAQRGKADLAALNSNSKIVACAQTCTALSMRNAPSDQAATQCLQDCAPAITRRLRTCNDLSWLPF